MTLDPVFASDAVTYTAAADHDVTSPAVTATAHKSSDTISIMKGTASYTSGGSVPLDVGPNVLTIEVTTVDGSPTPHTYTVTVTRAPNRPPAFGEGATTTRGVDENTGAGVNIGGAVAATDADNDTLTYSLDAAGAESFDIDAASGQLQTKAALDHETRASYTVTVSVRDSKDDNGDPDEVTDDTITVTILVADVNDSPAFPAATDTRSIPENTGAGVNVGAAVAASDDDNPTLTYSLDAAGLASFAIVQLSGQLQTKAALDFETGTRSYTVIVTAADPSAAEASVTVTITVENVEEPGTLTLSSPQPIVGTPLTATLTDPDGDISGLTWSAGWTTAGATSATYTPVSSDEGTSLRVTASYTDGQGSSKSAQATSANPVGPMPPPANNPPVFPSTETGARNIAENTDAGEDIGAPVEATDADNDTLTYTLDVADLAFFDIDAASGQLRTKAALDHETRSSYTVTVTATDTSDASDTISVTITVDNVEEPSTLTLSSLEPLVAIELTPTLVDPDDILGNVTWSWQRSADGISSWVPISGETSDSYTPVFDDVGDYLRVVASYEDGEGTGKSARAATSTAVEVAPGRNRPVFTEGPSTTRSVVRNTARGVNIGAPVSATDIDNDALTYSLGGRDRAGFDIDTSSGQLLTRAPLTGSVRTTYEVIVSVSDGKDDQGNPETDPQIDATTGVTITVTTPRSGGGGGGGGFGGPILSVVTVVAGEAAPADLTFGFAYACANALGEPLFSRTFTVDAGREYGTTIAAGLSCTLTVTDAAGATAVDGLFADVVIPPAGYKTTVTFTFGPVPTAVDPESETVVEEAGVALTIPAGSRDAPYAVLLETGGENCEGGLDLEGESIACHTVTVFDAEGAEETGVTLLVPATVTITLDAALVEELGGVEGVRAAREAGELRMLRRADADSPWAELPFTVEETDDGAVVVVLSVSAFSDFALIASEPRLVVLPLHADWNVVAWDGADGADIAAALGDIPGQVDVVYQWVAETQTWRSYRPGVPPARNAFDTFTRGATYWIRAGEAVEWTIIGGPIEPPATDPIRLHLPLDRSRLAGGGRRPDQPTRSALRPDNLRSSTTGTPRRRRGAAIAPTPRRSSTRSTASRRAPATGSPSRRPSSGWARPMERPSRPDEPAGSAARSGRCRRSRCSGAPSPGGSVEQAPVRLPPCPLPDVQRGAQLPQPLPPQAVVGDRLRDDAPVFGVVRAHPQVRQFMRHDVVQDRGRGHDRAPVEAQRPVRGAARPAAALTADQDRLRPHADQAPDPVDARRPRQRRRRQRRRRQRRRRQPRRRLPRRPPRWRRPPTQRPRRPGRRRHRRRRPPVRPRRRPRRRRRRRHPRRLPRRRRRRRPRRRRLPPGPRRRRPVSAALASPTATAAAAASSAAAAARSAAAAGASDAISRRRASSPSPGRTASRRSAAAQLARHGAALQRHLRQRPGRGTPRPVLAGGRDARRDGLSHRRRPRPTAAPAGWSSRWPR